MNYMKQLATFLGWLNHSRRAPEAQSPVSTSAFAALISFAFIYWLDGREVSALGIWWAETLIYSFIPILLAFIILYRSSWHQDMARSGRAILLAFVSCLILPGALIAAMIAFGLAVVGYYCFSEPLRFHY